MLLRILLPWALNCLLFTARGSGQTAMLLPTATPIPTILPSLTVMPSPTTISEAPTTMLSPIAMPVPTILPSLTVMPSLTTISKAPTTMLSPIATPIPTIMPSLTVMPSPTTTPEAPTTMLSLTTTLSTSSPLCVQTFRIEINQTDVYVMPGVVNCFSCALDTNGSVTWQVDNVTVDGDLIPVSSTSPDAEADGNFLVIAMPETYVQPGPSGRRDIVCTSLVNGQSLEARLASPVLLQPLFADATINEGELLEITCVTRNIPDITTLKILDPNGMPVSTTLGVFSVPSVTRTYTGTYTCVVTSTLDNTTVNATSTVVVQYIRCDAETTLSENGITYFWPRTLGGETASLTCPTRSNVIVMRNCSGEGLWQTVADDGCDSVNERLNQLNESFANLTAETYGNSVAVLSQIIALTENNTNEQTNEVLSTTANYFEELVDFVNESNVIINTTIIEDVVQVVNSLLQWEPVNIMVASSSSLIESFEIVVSTYAQQLSLNETQNFTTLSLTLVAELRSVDSLSQSGRSFLIGDTDAILGSEDQVEPGQLPAQLDAAISLPASLFEQINDRPSVGVFFAFYETPTLFPVGRESAGSMLPRQTAVSSDIIAATVGPGLNFQNLDELVTIVLRLQVPEGSFAAEGTEMCVSWDFTLRDWTTEGCTTVIGEDRVVTCNCNHLTNFAVLVDICLRQENCERSRVDQALTYISYIGISISIVCLVFTLLTILFFKKIREKDIAKYHIQLCSALLFMYVLTLILIVFSAERVDTIYGGCVSLSLLVHYFTLVAVMWMGAEALLMFQKLVIIFVRITKKFFIIVSTICWTIPIVFVLVPFIVDMANGRDDASDIIIQRAEKKDDISYCFLSNIGALVGAFLAPIFVVIAFNMVFFIWVIVVVSRHAKKKADRMKQTLSKKEILRITFSLSGVLFLFGLTWGFFILTFSIPGIRETFQILFTVFNSLQGFFIFAFIFFTEGFGYWKAILSCKKYKSNITQLSTPGTKSTTAPNSLPRQDKNASETSCNNETTEMNNEKLELKEQMFSSDIDSVNTLDSSSSVNQLQNDQQCNSTESEQQDLEGGLKKQTGTKPLSVLVKRYSTKKYKRHHVEEVKIKFYDEDCSSSSDEDGLDAYSAK